MKKTKIIIFVLLILTSLKSLGQITISGNIHDTKGIKLSLVNVLLKDAKSTIKAYAYSDDKGNYLIKVQEKGEYNLIFSSLGYKSKSIHLNVDGTQKRINIDVILTEKPVELNEVIIQSERAIVIKKDTISFKTKFFTDGTEQTVEDLLKKIPGLHIDVEGTVKLGNKEIEKIMVEGDDFFDKGYRILSKNMPAYPIEEVEVLKRYSNNRLLKDIEESDKVALNLKLNEKSKQIWFGNVKIGSSLKNKYELLANLMNFGKKNKFYFLVNFNNIGNDATEDIKNLIRPFYVNSSVGDNQQVENLIGLSAVTININKNRTNFNNAKLLSLNTILNPTKKLKIKMLGFLNLDERFFFRSLIDNITVSGINFTNNKDFELKNKELTGFGKLDFIYNISKTEMLESTTRYNNGNTNAQSNLTFNGIPDIENLKSNNTLLNQKISYSNKFKNKKVLLLTGRFIEEKTLQTYKINHFYYRDLFPNYSTADNVIQESINQMQFAGFDAHLLDRKQSENLLELQIGNTFRKDKLNTIFTLLENSNVLGKPFGFQNHLIYQTGDLYFKTKYRYKLKNIGITGKLGFHQLFNRLDFNTISKYQYLFYINPDIGFDWKINAKNKILTSYSYNTTNTQILNVYNNFVLTGFDSFSKGTGNFNQLNASVFLFNYQLGNWCDRFFANVSVLFNKNFDFLSTNSIINQNYTLLKKIVVKDRELFSITSELDYFLKKISSNIKFDLGYSKSNYKNVVNNLNLRDITSNNYKYGLELRSGFKGAFNFHIGTKWKTNQIEVELTSNSFTDNFSFLDLFFVFNDKFNIQFKSERYFFGNLDEKNRTYYFLDLDAKYTVIKNKLTLAFTGKNLFDTKIYKIFSISDIGTSIIEYKLLERLLFLKVVYRL